MATGTLKARITKDASLTKATVILGIPKVYQLRIVLPCGNFLEPHW
jgi:hypothetical protein